MLHLKVMFTSIQEGIIWNASTEEQVKISHPSYDLLNEHIDVSNWIENYSNLYLEWLNNDVEYIFDINHFINSNMVNSLIELNESTKEFKIYYWFDVNRDKYPDFVWDFCPLSDTLLINLPDSFHMNNKKISTVFPLIFPG